MKERRIISSCNSSGMGMIDSSECSGSNEYLWEKFTDKLVEVDSDNDRGSRESLGKLIISEH